MELFALNYLEVVGVVFGFLTVFLNVRQNIWCWPTGIVSVSAYLVLFYDERLYADMVLQAIYIVLSVYGWYYWLKEGPKGDTAPVTRANPRSLVVLAVAGAVTTVGCGWGLVTYTDADLPYWDALTTVMSLIGQWLLARKVLENWLVWIAVDVLYVGIYYYKELYLTSGLFATFLVLAAIGYVQWKKSMAATTA